MLTLAGSRQTQIQNSHVIQSPRPSHHTMAASQGEDGECRYISLPIEGRPNACLESLTGSQLPRSDNPMARISTKAMGITNLGSTLENGLGLLSDSQQALHVEHISNPGLAPLQGDAQHNAGWLCDVEGQDPAFVDLNPGESSSPTGQTALHMAVRVCNIDMAHRLLAYGADVNAKDSKGSTPLHHAVAYSFRVMVALLVDWHADILCRDQNGRQPLHIAVDSGASTNVDLLVRAGADINAQTWHD